MEIIIKDQATAVLDAIGAKRNQYKQVAEAMGLALVSLAIRSFNEESLRAAPWAALKEATIARKLKEGTSSAILKRHGLLWRSWRVVEATNSFVRVGSDRPYAGVHQFGSRDGRTPARPMLPMTGGPESPTFTALAVQRMVSVAKTALAGLMLPRKGTPKKPPQS